VRRNWNCQLQPCQKRDCRVRIVVAGPRRARASGKIAIARARARGRIARTLFSRSMKRGGKLRSASLPTWEPDAKLAGARLFGVRFSSSETPVSQPLPETLAERFPFLSKLAVTKEIPRNFASRVRFAIFICPRTELPLGSECPTNVVIQAESWRCRRRTLSSPRAGIGQHRISLSSITRSQR